MINILKPLTALIILISINVKAYSQENHSEYSVNYSEKGTIKIDGELSPKEWESVQVIEQAFHYPWRTEKAPSTKFRAAWNELGLYFSFDVTDKNIVLADTDIGENAVDYSDRVEIFLDPTPTDQKIPSLKNYNAVEIAPNNVVHEYSAQYYRNFDSRWALDNSKYETKINDHGYSVEGFISIESLSALGINIQKGSSAFVGLFRAEFNGLQNSLQRKWISWIDPKSENPDFHLPAAFGIMKFIKE